MSNATGPTRTVQVTWRTDTSSTVTTPVSLTEGYTDEASIPRILAIAYLGGVDDASRIDIISIH